MERSKEKIEDYKYFYLKVFKDYNIKEALNSREQPIIFLKHAVRAFLFREEDLKYSEIQTIEEKLSHNKFDHTTIIHSVKQHSNLFKINVVYTRIYTTLKNSVYKNKQYDRWCKIYSTIKSFDNKEEVIQQLMDKYEVN